MKLNKALNTINLNNYCLLKDEQFFNPDLGTVVETTNGKYLHIDNGSNILAVAHVDTAIGVRPLIQRDIRGVHVGFSASLDDRLGVYILCDLLPKMGVVVDVLLTEGEESGRSTSQFFKTTKEYNWMFQFDRRGTDVVMYQYETEDYLNLLRAAGFRTGVGTFSDICYLDHLGITGFNFGCAYYDEHSERCRVDFQYMLAQVGKFMLFYNMHKNTKLEYIEKPRTYTKWSMYNDWANYDQSYKDWWAKKARENTRVYSGKLVELDDEILGEYVTEYDEDTDLLLVLCPECDFMVEEEDFSFNKSMCYECSWKGQLKLGSGL